MTRSPDLDPRQLDCWERYINPKSETFANAKRSAMAAGYSDAHSEDIKAFEWFKRMEHRSKMQRMRVKAEDALEEMLDMPVNVIEYTGLGEDRTPVVTTDTTLVKIKQDTAKFAVERLGKDEWSTRQELTGADGERLIDADAKRKSDEAINDFLNGNPTKSLPEGPDQSNP